MNTSFEITDSPPTSKRKFKRLIPGGRKRSRSPPKSKTKKMVQRTLSPLRRRLSLSPPKRVGVNFDKLLDVGVQVFKGPQDIHKILKDFHKQQIEFLDPATPNLIMGGFGAYANPTSFHHPEIRAIRREVYDYLFPSLKETFPGRNVEMLLDRFAKRSKGTQPMAESWHRDVTNSKTKLDDDEIYGGWINLDPPGSEPQRFSCVPSTHKDAYTGKGFDKIPKEKIPYYKERKQVFEIPPGHIIMFNQDLVHEVFPKKSKFDSYRLFCGWRVTRGKIPLYDNAKVFEDQGIPQLGGGMLPPMYYANHWQYPGPRENLINFSQTVRPEFREDRLMKTQNKIFNIVQRYMKSLREAGLQMWPEYKKVEKDMFIPK
jgi:hypothetical protein